MPRGRILVLAAATVIAIVVASVAVLQAEMNWDRYRGSFELLAGEALGRPVTIAGPISLSLLPAPVLTASQVRVGGGGDQPRILVAQLRLRVALLPLLMGSVDARALTLQRPDLRLPWPPWRSLLFVIPPWLSALSARIENGRIEAGSLILTHVDATFTAGRGNTALTLAGSAVLGSNTWELALRLGEPAGDGSALLQASLKGGGAAAGAVGRISGRLSPDGRLSGHLALDGPNLSELLPSPALPFHADGDFSLDHAVARLQALSMTLGSASAAGSGSLVLEPSPRLDLVLSSESTVPLDPWLPVLRRATESQVPVGLTFTAPRAILARGLLQNLDLAVVLGSHGVQIGGFRAIVPGDAAFAMEGRLAAAPGRARTWQFAGTAHLTAPALGTTLHWFEAAAPGILPPLPAALLGTATIGGRVVVGASGIAFDGLAGTLDQSKVSGSLTLGIGGQPTISAGLTLDQLNLDPLLPPRLRMAATHQDFRLAAVPRLFAGMSVELRLAIGEATLGQTKMSDLTLDAAAEPGQVIVRRLDATIKSVHVIASGTIGAGGVVTAGHLALAAPGPAVLAASLPAPVGTAVGHWKAAFALDATAAGPPQRLALSMSATLGDLRLTADPILDLASGTWQGPITVRYPGAAELVTASGLANPIAWLGPGSFSVIGQAAGGPSGWSLKRFQLVAGTLHASGKLEKSTKLDGTEVTATVHATALPLPPPAIDAGALLPALLGNGRARIDISADRVVFGSRTILMDLDGWLRVMNQKGTLELSGDLPGGGSLVAALRMEDAAGPPRISIGAALSGAHLKSGLFAAIPDLESGTLDGEAALTAQGFGRDALVATLGGTIALRAEDGTISGLSLGSAHAALAGKMPARNAQAALERALQGGQSRFDRFSLAAHGAAGRFTLGHGRMEGSEGIVTAQGTIDLPSQSEDLRLEIQPALAGAPAAIVRFSGSISDPKRMKETGALLQWLAGRAH